MKELIFDKNKFHFSHLLTTIQKQQFPYLQSNSKQMSDGQTQFIHTLTTYKHQLNMHAVKEKTGKILIARGYLIGQFYGGDPISYRDEVTFIGNFSGFFTPSKDKYDPFHLLEYYFEGRIDELKMLQVDKDNKEEDVILVDQIKFIGYFKGHISEQTDTTDDGMISSIKLNLLQDLKNQFILKVVEQYQVILPTYTTFKVKAISSVNLEKSLAEIMGDMRIDIQISNELINIFQNNSDQSIILTLNKEISIELPLRQGEIISSNSYIECTFDRQFCIISYKISKTFQAEIDTTYAQFFSPFNLTHFNIVITFLQMSVRDQQNCKNILINFVNLDTDDKIDNNPYTSCNSLFQGLFKQNQKFQNRISKINSFQSHQSGEYIIATNYLTLFSYHNRTIKNSDHKRTNNKWVFGLAKKDYFLKQPTVNSIPECYQNLKNIKMQNKGKLSQPVHQFHFSYWKHVHIQIPVYKYWVINVIQIFVPIFILGILSLFVFSQQNGTKSDGTSTMNSRINNVAAILLAYVALVPMIKQNAPRATSFSFIYIVIYLSIVPHILALISSIRDQHMPNTYWENNYDPFKDPLFLASFMLLLFLFGLVLIVVLVFIRFSYTDYQIQLMPSHIRFKRFKSACSPWRYRRFIARLSDKRGDQFIFQRFSCLQILKQKQNKPTSTFFLM